MALNETRDNLLMQFSPDNYTAANFRRIAERFLQTLDGLIQAGNKDEAKVLIESSGGVFSGLVPDIEIITEIKSVLLTYLEQHLTREITFQGRNYQIPAELLDNLTRGGENTRYNLHFEDLSAEPTNKVIKRNIRGEIETVGQISGDQTLFLTRPSEKNICTIVKIGDKVYLGYDNVSQDGNPRLVILILSQAQLDELNRKIEVPRRLS